MREWRIYSGFARVGGVVKVSISAVAYQIEVDVPDGVYELQRQQAHGKHVINVKGARSNAARYKSLIISVEIGLRAILITYFCAVSFDVTSN